MHYDQPCCANAPLADWERELLNGVDVGTVRVTYRDGHTRDFHNIRYEANTMNEKGFLIMESNEWDAKIYRIPNVDFIEVLEVQI